MHKNWSVNEMHFCYALNYGLKELLKVVFTASRWRCVVSQCNINASCFLNLYWIQTTTLFRIHPAITKNNLAVFSEVHKRRNVASFLHTLQLLSSQNFKDGAHFKCLPLCWEHEKASSSHVTYFTRLNLTWRIAFALKELKAIFAWTECWSSSDDTTLKLFLVLCYSINMQTMLWQCSHFLCLHQGWSTFDCLNMNPTQEIRTLCSLTLHSASLLSFKGIFSLPSKSNLILNSVESAKWFLTLFPNVVQMQRQWFPNWGTEVKEGVHNQNSKPP